jgi:F-type H+-transporting ATPase subunit epsilon
MGVILVRYDSSLKWSIIVITGGIALITENKMTVLVNEAELGSNINVQEAEARYLATKIALEQNTDSKRIFELTYQFKKARAKFQYVQISKDFLSIS